MNPDKIDSANMLIEKALSTCKKPCVLFSGGKDSTAVLHLVRCINSDIPAVFNNTGVEAKETIQYIKMVDNVHWNTPEKTFWQCVDEYGLPQLKSKATRHGNQCCYWLKERPGDIYAKENNIDLTFTGLTASESRQRWLTLKRVGALYRMKNGMWKCHPIWDWEEKDVWDFIRENNLPYNTLYDNGAKRCGCQPCTAYLGWKKNLARENPKMLKLILKLQGQAQLPCTADFGVSEWA